MKLRMRSKSRRRENISGWLFAAPWMIGFVGLTAFPLVYSLYLSLTNATTNRLTSDWRGFANYQVILTDSEFWKSVLNTLQFVALSVPMNLLFALALALLLHVKVKGSKLFRALYYIPTLVTIVSVAYLWRQLLGPDGILNALLGVFGIQGPDWFRDYRFATLGMALMGMWSVGGVIVIFLSSLTDVPQELYEAVEVDGGTGRHKFFQVTLPAISPIFFYNLLTATIAAFQVFVQPMLMTSGNYNTNYLAYNIYETGFTVGRQGYASAMSWLMLIIIAIAVTIIQIARKRWAFYGE